MPKKLATASIYTLLLLSTFLAALVLAIMYYGGKIDAVTLIIAVVAINFLAWLIGPYITTLVLKWLYKIQFYNQQEFSTQHAELSAFILKVCTEHKIPFPKMGVINDDNPTAFAYGSGAFNARVVITQGLFTYLQPDEIEAVVAHELGHIVHKDFIVMSVANTIIQIMYEIYVIFAKKNKKGKKNAFFFIGLAAYIFYIIGYYIVLYLNRMREMYADEFSAEITGQPHALSNALVKIGYGIVSKEDDDKSKRLLESTGTMGIMGATTAKEIGLVAKATEMDSKKIGKVLLFDFVSPWAKLAELGATHPLTGKRLVRMDELAVQKGQPMLFNMPQIIAENPVDKQKLWEGFTVGALVYLLPFIVAAIGLLSAAAIPLFHISLQPHVWLSFWVVVFGLSLLMKTAYKYPEDKNIAPATVLELMSDVYASPVKGRAVVMDGKVVGKGVAGYAFSEDVMLQDQTGLMYMDYQAGIPLIGNLIFALAKVKKLIGQPVQARGWFFRSNYQFLVLSSMQNSASVYKSYAKFWNVVVGLFAMFFGVIWLMTGEIALAWSISFVFLILLLLLNWILGSRTKINPLPPPSIPMPPSQKV